MAVMILDMDEAYGVLDQITEIQSELVDMLRMRVAEIDFLTIRRDLNRD